MSEDKGVYNTLPSYVAEEEEEEESIITLDFENQTIYEADTTLLMREADNEVITPYEEDEDEEDNESEEVPPPPPNVPAFKSELQDILMDSITSKAVASLLEKHRTLDKEVDLAIDEASNMGELKGLLSADIHKTMEKRRHELRAAFNGAGVNYNAIPEWAKSYVRQYVRDAVIGIAVLIED